MCFSCMTHMLVLKTFLPRVVSNYGVAKVKRALLKDKVHLDVSSAEHFVETKHGLLIAF